MKRKKFIIGLGAIALALGGAAFSLNLTNSIGTVVEATTDTSPVTYLPFNSTNFSCTTEENWSADSWVTERDGTFWSTRYVNGLDAYYDGNRDEKWIGTISSIEFIQTEDYIVFTFGGSKDYSQNYVSVMSGTEEVARVTNEGWFDTENLKYLAVNMAVRVVDASKYKGQTLHLELVDNTTSDYGMIMFGALHVNQTVDGVARLLRAHMETMNTSDADNLAAKQYVEALYKTNYGNETYYKTATSALTYFNDGFETADSLIDWHTDLNYTMKSDEGAYWPLYNKGILADDHYWDTDIPYNQTGNGHLDSWNFAPDEGAKYRIVSPSFVLSSDYISVKMGGEAAIIWIYADSEWTELSKNTKFKDGAYPITQGHRQATMTRYIIDVSAYKGKTVNIGLGEYRTGTGWGVSFFDELITNYSGSPSFPIDIVNQTITSTDTAVAPQGPGEYYGAILTEYVGTASTTVKSARAFLETYFSTCRVADNEFTYCDLATSSATAIGNIITAYDSLSSEVKAIVDASDDFSYSGGGYYITEIDTYTVGDSMTSMKYYYNSTSSAFNVSNMLTEDSTEVMLVLIVGAAVVALFATIFIIKRKRHAE